MQYPCPARSDLDEIRALNSAFLSACAIAPAANNVTTRIASLQHTEQASLSRAPFLLFGLREDEPALWERVFGAEPDFLDHPTDPVWIPITTSAIAFLWHLAKRAPHDARLFAACSPSFCRRLAERRLISVTHRALAHGVRPEPRFSNSPGIWEALIDAAKTPDSERQGVGRMVAMQRLLLTSSEVDTELLAARRIDAVSRSLSE